jgi:hypothetical protein
MNKKLKFKIKNNEFVTISAIVTQEHLAGDKYNHTDCIGYRCLMTALNTATSINPNIKNIYIRNFYWGVSRSQNHYYHREKRWISYNKGKVFDIMHDAKLGDVIVFKYK